VSFAQDLPRIDVAIEDGSLARRPVLLALIEKAKSTRHAVHVMGLYRRAVCIRTRITSLPW